MKRRRFSREFKQEAARMLIIEGLRAKEVSDQLGVGQNLLYRWKQQHIDDLEASRPEGAQSPKEMAAEIADLRKQLAKSQRMNEILKKNGGLLQQGRVMQYRIMSDNRDRFSVEEMCECLGLSRSGFYDWQLRRPSR